MRYSFMATGISVGSGRQKASSQAIAMGSWSYCQYHYWVSGDIMMRTARIRTDWDSRAKKAAAQSEAMPIFEYRCAKCQSDFEQLVLGPKAESAIACPTCGSRDVEKLYSSFFGHTRTGEGTSRSLSSGCSSCQASSCAGCKIR